MHNPKPAVSIIIPSHNRSVRLRQTLNVLRLQRYPLDQVEVVVVADGCVDDTVNTLRNYEAPFALEIVELPGSGAAAARNAGAARAKAPLLIFLDDDVEPGPACIAAHVRAHQAHPGQAVIGPYPPFPMPHRSLFRLHMRYWWETKFKEIAHSGHRFSYQDLLTGNLSLDAQTFTSAGGLDSNFRKSGEDYEFGLRLLKAGITLVYAPDALAYHHEHDTASIDSAFRRAYNEGHTDVLMGEKHPEIRPFLPLVVWRTNTSRRERALARRFFSLREPSDVLANTLRKQLELLEAAGMQKQWTQLYNHLRFYWYLRGATEELGSPQELARYAWEIMPVEQQPTCVIDLRDGLEAAEQRLDEERPESVQLLYGLREIGIMPAQPGAERWRSAHLRPFLARSTPITFLQALALDGKLCESSWHGRKRLANSIQFMGNWYGVASTSHMWSEQYSQWNTVKSRPQDDGNQKKVRQGPGDERVEYTTGSIRVNAVQEVAGSGSLADSL